MKREKKEKMKMADTSNSVFVYFRGLHFSEMSGFPLRKAIVSSTCFLMFKYVIWDVVCKTLGVEMSRGRNGEV